MINDSLPLERHFQPTSGPSSDRVIGVQTDNRVIYANPSVCKFLGYEADELVGSSMNTICGNWPEEAFQNNPARMKRASCLGKDLTLRHKDGRSLPVTVTVRSSTTLHGSRHYFLSIRESQQDLPAANRVGTLAPSPSATHFDHDFIATLTHELRSPLTAILGFADTLQSLSDLDLSATTRTNLLSAITRNGQHLLDLIDDLSHLPSLQTGRLQTKRTPTSPLKLAQEITMNFLAQAHRKHLRLGIECSTPIPRRIDLDPKAMRQILTNLIGNAIKFTSQGHVTVRLDTENLRSKTPRLVISIEDSGIGIATEFQESIFAPFTCGHDRNNCQATGNGLGLAICQRLVTAAGGEISVKSSVGVGSVFTFTVPFTDHSETWQPPAQDLAPQCITEPVQKLAKGNLEKKRVLVIDDSPDIQDLVILFLEQAGSIVNAVSDGETGVRNVLQFLKTDLAYDLVLLDMGLPGVDGLATAEQLRTLGVRCPIIAITASTTMDVQRACLAAGCSTFLRKPFDLRLLLETIERQLSPSQPVIRLPSDSEHTYSEELAPATFQPLRTKFLARLPGTLGQLRAARAQGDLNKVSTIVHQLSGTAANYSFPQVTQMADKCETALRSQTVSQEDMDKSLDQLTTLVTMILETHPTRELH